jgi:uncharacterized phage protein gp47/JayE
MPNQLDGSGLQIKTLDEIKSSLIQGLQAIFGSDINVDQNSPDGQLIGIFAQAALDNLELLQQIYASFAVNQAFGTLLDQRVALNGLSRQPGSYTFTDVDVTVDRALTLAGLDADVGSADGEGFTVADDAGNQFILAETEVIAAPGVYTLSFRAKVIGAVQTTPNTITNQVTVTLGVTDINNPSAASIIGDDEETDMALKIRHSASFNLAATGPADAMEAALRSVSDVTDAIVVENDTSGTVLGIPARSIWAIVEGGANNDIGQAIYSKKIPGCGQKGAEEVTITRPNGTTFVGKFDRPVYENLYIRFTIVPKYSGVTFDTDAIKASLVAALHYSLRQSANIGDVVVAMLAIAPNGFLTTVGVSDNGTDWDDVLDPTDYQHKFVLDVSRITVTA